MEQTKGKNTMKEKTNRELKNIAVTALRDEYGFAPKPSDVILLEASGDGTYILFRVAEHEYRFNSYISHYGDMETIWCGKGTITKNS